MDVARLNFSHGTHEQHAVNIAKSARRGEENGASAGFIAGFVRAESAAWRFWRTRLCLKRGQAIGFTADAAKEIDRDCPILPLPVPELIAVLKPNHTLLLDDGKIALRVVKVEGPNRATRRGLSGRNAWRAAN